MMRLATLLDENLLDPNLQATTKPAAVEILLSNLGKKEQALDLKKISKLILARENVEDTSYGRGFAFPHARTDLVSKMHLAIGIARDGLEDCRDGCPLQIVCLLLTPSNISKLYLQTLSALATFARGEGNLTKLLSANSSSDMMDVFWNSGVMVNKEITASDLMRHEPVTVGEKQTLREVANLMFHHRLSALPVVDEDATLIGQISDRDLLTSALPDYKTLATQPDHELPTEPFEELLTKADRIDVSQVYQDDYETASPDDHIVRVSAQIIAKGLRRVYIVDENRRLLGTLHRKDIVNMILRG